LSAIDFHTVEYPVLGISIPVDKIVPSGFLKGPGTKEEEEFLSGSGNKKETGNAWLTRGREKNLPNRVCRDVSKGNAGISLLKGLKLALENVLQGTVLHWQENWLDDLIIFHL